MSQPLAMHKSASLNDNLNEVVRDAAKSAILRHSAAAPCLPLRKG
ncbi:MAG: hypothetical protein ACJA06_002403 [Halocynthiibacter sp.]|jgi:hypothetical protein